MCHAGEAIGSTENPQWFWLLCKSQPSLLWLKKGGLIHSWENQNRRILGCGRQTLGTVLSVLHDSRPMEPVQWELKHCWSAPNILLLLSDVTGQRSLLAGFIGFQLLTEDHNRDSPSDILPPCPQLQVRGEPFRQVILQPSLFNSSMVPFLWSKAWGSSMPTKNPILSTVPLRNFKNRFFLLNRSASIFKTFS